MDGYDGITAVSQGNTTTRLAVFGELDYASAQCLVQEVVECARHSSAVELDLSAVAFLDASGIGALVSGAKVASDLGVQVRIVAMSDAAKRLLTMTGHAVHFGCADVAGDCCSQPRPD